MNDQEVRRLIFERIIVAEVVPRVAEIATALEMTNAEAAASLRRLHDGHVLVLDSDNEIIMANPFSAIPTSFAVRSGKKSWFGNCIWDALGILALLKTDGIVQTTCADCSSPMTLEIRKGALMPQRGLVHFALPVKQWWNNIVFT